MSEEHVKYDVSYMAESPKNPFDVQVDGNHYKEFKIQPVEFIHANGLDFLQGNVVKYVTRFRHKNGEQDLLKARHYIDLLLELEYPVPDVDFEEVK